MKTRLFGQIRTRMAMWHVLSMAVVVLAYSASASLLLLHHLRDQLVQYAIQDLETVEGLLYFGGDGQLTLRDDYHNHPESREVLQRLMEVRSPNGNVLYRNQLLGNRSLGGIPAEDEGAGGYSPHLQLLEDGTAVQVVSRQHRIAGWPTIIRVGYSEAPLWQHFRGELVLLLLPLPFVLAAAGITGYLLARRALLPIQLLTRRAEQVTSERLDARLPIDSAHGELAELTGVFNGMLARLEQSFHQLRRFTSDASHELRTPLTAIRSVGEVGLEKSVTREEYRDVIGSMLEEAGRLTGLVESLLLISRADAGQLVLRRTDFPAIHLAHECSSLFEVLLEERDQQLQVAGDPRLVISGDWLLLRQALLNIVDNALKYSPHGGLIRIGVWPDIDSNVVIEVEDSGPGIPVEDRERVFGRFYRVDSGRSRETGGAGLGLSIAQWTIDAHGGSIAIHGVPGAGCRVRVVLPPSGLRPLPPGSEPRTASSISKGVNPR